MPAPAKRLFDATCLGALSAGTDCASRAQLVRLVRERLAMRLLEEAPSAYKPIANVMRAQKELVRIERRLRPVLTYKGT